MISENKRLRIDSAGVIYYENRLSAILTCHMKFHYFPMDVQTCGLNIESFAYDIEDLQFEWLENGINLRQSCKFDQLCDLSSAFSKEFSAQLSFF